MMAQGLHERWHEANRKRQLAIAEVARLRAAVANASDPDERCERERELQAAGKRLQIASCAATKALRRLIASETAATEPTVVVEPTVATRPVVQAQSLPKSDPDLSDVDAVSVAEAIVRRSALIDPRSARARALGWNITDNRCPSCRSLVLRTRDTIECPLCGTLADWTRRSVLSQQWPQYGGIALGMEG